MSTELYNELIYAKTRKTYAAVDYSLTAPDSKDDGTLSLPPGNEISRGDQVMNGIRDMPAPIATLEPDYWRLDGTFILPVPPEVSDLEVGWWSFAMSDENGILPEPLVIERVFEQVQTFHTLGIAFDSASDNYCTDFDVFFYDAHGALLYSESITGNEDAYRRTERGGIDVLRVVIKLYRTNRPFRYARVIELDFGLVIAYNGSDIKSLSVVRESDPAGRAFPFPELKLTVLNRGNYDPLDSSTYAPYFQTRQRFGYRHGLEMPDKSVVWIDCGTFFLSKWKVTDALVEFTATSTAALMENSSFYDSSLEEFTVAQLIRRIIPNAAADLQSPRVTGYFGNVDYRRMLTYLSELSCCLVYEDKGNVIRFADILSAEDTPSGTIGYDAAYSMRTEVSQYYNAINLAEYTPSIETRQISKTKHEPGEITVYFDNPVTGVLEYALTDGFTLSEIRWNAMYMTAMLSGSGTAELVITGDSVTFTKSETIYRAPWHTGKEPDNPYKIDLPCMIRTESFPAFRDWFLARRFAMMEKRLECSLTWMQNPAFDVADRVNVQINSKGSTTNAFITRQELNFDGALTGSTKAIALAEMR